MSSGNSGEIRGFFKALCTYGVGSLLQSSLTFLLLPLYLSSFTPSEFGVLSILLVVQTIAVMVLGGGLYAVISRVYYERSLEERRELAGTCLLLVSSLGLCGGVVLYFSSTYFSGLLFDDTAHAHYFVLLAGSTFFTLIRDFPGTLCRIESKATQYVLLAFLSVILDFALKILFINNWGRGVAGYFESSILAALLFLLIALPTVAKLLRLKFQRSSAVQLLKLGSPYILSGASMWTLEFSDRLLIEYFMDTKAVGIYSLGYTFAAVFTVTVARPVALILDPFIFSHLAKKDEGLGRMLAHVLTGSLIIGGVAYLFLSLCSEEVLRGFTLLIDMDAAYFDAMHLVPFLTAIPFLYFLSNPPGIALLWAKKTLLISVISALCALSNIALNIILIPRFGLEGAATASIISYMTQAVLLYVLAEQYVKSEYRLRRDGLLLFILGVSLCAGLSVTLNPLLAFAFDLFVIFVLFLGGGCFCIVKSGGEEWDFVQKVFLNAKKIKREPLRAK